MKLWTRIRETVLGPALDPMNQNTRHAMAVIPLLAWVGLGADGLSSSCYGPEEAFLALGGYSYLGIYLAIATAVTVFIISIGYNQVIQLFPTGGGGYRIATALLGPKTGLVSGSALIVDYVLTIATSIASGADAFFSLFSPEWQLYKLPIEVGLVLFLAVLNFRGMKESIMILLPIFMGFVVVHAFLIIYGIGVHASRIPDLIPHTLDETHTLSQLMGPVFVTALLLRAFSLGGGTYTGLEAVSNNVNLLAEPRVPNGKRTMFYMALSLAFTAGGIILLYVLWAAVPEDGQTLNAVVFRSVIAHLGWGGTGTQHAFWMLVLMLEAGLLVIAAQTGFLDGPMVLANMAADSWVPRYFRGLSTRLVRQNGVLVMSVGSVIILLWTHGDVSALVVLYSINVFLTFSLSLLGLCVYWLRHRAETPSWLWRFGLSALSLTVTTCVLIITVIEKFSDGGWLTVLVTGFVIAVCMLIKKHYDETRNDLAHADALFTGNIPAVEGPLPAFDLDAPTAVILVGKHRGASMHALLWVMRLFPNHFRNFIFLAVGEVDSQSYAGQEQMERLRAAIEEAMQYYTRFCQHAGLAAEYHISFGTDPIALYTQLARTNMSKYRNSVCFASKLIFPHTNFLTGWLHNQGPAVVQQALHLNGKQMVLLPMRVGRPSGLSMGS